jgi:uncharacterized membrane protein
MSENLTPSAHKTYPLAIVSLILGILGVLSAGITCCIGSIISSIIGLIFGVAALILSIVVKNQIKKENGPPSQNKMATAGLILGIIAAGLGIIGLALSTIIQLTLRGPQIENLFNEIIEQLEEGQ